MQNNENQMGGWAIGGLLGEVVFGGFVVDALFVGRFLGALAVGLFVGPFVGICSATYSAHYSEICLAFLSERLS
jgi:hypothetical protein